MELALYVAVLIFERRLLNKASASRPGVMTYTLLRNSITTTSGRSICLLSAIR